jgi:hypothetical protein
LIKRGASARLVRSNPSWDSKKHTIASGVQSRNRNNLFLMPEMIGATDFRKQMDIFL